VLRSLSWIKYSLYSFADAHLYFAGFGQLLQALYGTHADDETILFNISLVTK